MPPRLTPQNPSAGAADTTPSLPSLPPPPHLRRSRDGALSPFPRRHWAQLITPLVSLICSRAPLQAPKKDKAPPPSSKPAKSGGGKQKKKVIARLSDFIYSQGGISSGGGSHSVVRVC